MLDLVEKGEDEQEVGVSCSRFSLNTRDKKHFTRKAWPDVTIEALMKMGLMMWDDWSKFFYVMIESKYQKKRRDTSILNKQ